MNYLKYYIKICKNARNRNLQGYFENHHIFPKCIFGKNNKIVALTAKEHFICHFLLFKFVKKRHGYNHLYTRKLGYAFYKMTISSKNQQRYTSRTYKFIKEWYVNNNPSRFINRQGANNHMFGKTNELHPLYGIPCSEERKKKIGQANKGRLAGDRNPSKRKEVREKISKKNRDGRTAQHGNNHPNYNAAFTTDLRLQLKQEWEIAKINGTSLYRFKNETAKKYNCKPSMIQSIIYKSPNIIVSVYSSISPS